MHNYRDESKHILESSDARNQKCCVSVSIDVHKLFPPTMKMLQLKSDISQHAWEPCCFPATTLTFGVFDWTSAAEGKTGALSVPAQWRQVLTRWETQLFVANNTQVLMKYVSIANSEHVWRFSVVQVTIKDKLDFSLWWSGRHMASRPKDQTSPRSPGQVSWRQLNLCTWTMSMLVFAFPRLHESQTTS